MSQHHNENLVFSFQRNRNKLIIMDVRSAELTNMFNAMLATHIIYE